MKSENLDFAGKHTDPEKKKNPRHRSLLSYQDRDQKSKPPKEDHHIIMIEQSLNIIELDNKKRDMDSDRHVKTK